MGAGVDAEARVEHVPVAALVGRDGGDVATVDRELDQHRERLSIGIGGPAGDAGGVDRRTAQGVDRAEGVALGDGSTGVRCERPGADTENSEGRHSPEGGSADRDG